MSNLQGVENSLVAFNVNIPQQISHYGISLDNFPFWDIIVSIARACRQETNTHNHLEEYRGIGEALRAWYCEARQAEWTTPDDLKRLYPGAEILPGERVVIKIKGNPYRLVEEIHCNTGIVDNHFTGMYIEYDRINAETI